VTIARQISIAALLAAAVAMPALAAGEGTDWPTYGHDKGGMRFTPLADITPANVTKLAPAWTYHMKPAETAPAASSGAGESAQRAAEGVGARRPRTRFSQSEATPIVVGNVMYVSTPYNRVVALDATTGAELWSRVVPGPGQPSLRGVEYWPGDRTVGARILFGTRDGRLVALDAKTGAFAAGFGSDGVVELKTPDILQGEKAGYYGMSSPPIVWRDLVITGSATPEFPPRGPAGDIRAWDVRTGKLVWTFHTVPRPGEAGYETWEPGSTERRTGVNNWGFMTADVARGILYLPLGAPTFDRYGGDRKGDNLYGTSVIALDAATGKLKWHFQIVHHDIWDGDAEAAPALFDVKKGGKTIPAVGVVSKSGLVFLLDRVTGKPIHPVQERPVPPSDVPGEKTSPTQPFPVVTPPLVRTHFDPKTDIADVAPGLKDWCSKWIADNNMKSGDIYMPVAFNRTTISLPGLQGGANWGGMSFSPALGLLFVNTNELGQVTSLVPAAAGSPLPYERGSPSARFSKPDERLMCQAPPWGQLSAIDVKTGKIAWHVTLGVSDNVPAANAKTGRPNIGGSIATASGLVFIGATDDSRFRAFDAKTGRELWTMKLDASAHATPVSYRGTDGRQFVTVVATGGSFLDSPINSDAVTAFALPRQGAR
jgi:quinoprotein glucose dehydrogenase